MAQVKRYLCIGEKIGDQMVASIHLPRLYKVHPEACEFTQFPMPEDQHARFKKLIWLRPQANGVYKIPDHSTCKCGATMIWMVTASNKRIPVDCRCDIVGEKVFDATRMTSHFVTCPLAKEFRKSKSEMKGPK